MSRVRLREWAAKAGLIVWLGGVLALGGVGLGRAISVTHPQLDLPDFGTYYLASRTLEATPEAIYDIAALESTQRDNAVPSWAPPYAYPPFVAGILRPVARLPYQQAATLWLGINSICLLAGLAVVLAVVHWPGGQLGTLAVLVALVLFTPAQEAILLGQVGPILLLLIAGALLCLEPSRPGREIFAGALLGLATVIKVFPVLLLGYLVLRKRWYAIGGSIVLGGVCMLAGIGWGGGWTNTWRYLVVVLPNMYGGRLAFVHLGNQSLTAFFLRPMGAVPLARWLGMGAVLIVLGATGLALLLRRPQRLIEEYALVSMLPLLILSGVYTHMYVLALLPMAVLVRAWYAGKRWLAIPILLAFLLMIVNSYSEWLGLIIAQWVPFGLIGTLMLWGVLLQQVMQRVVPCQVEPASRA